MDDAKIKTMKREILWAFYQLTIKIQWTISNLLPISVWTCASFGCEIIDFLSFPFAHSHAAGICYLYVGNKTKFSFLFLNQFTFNQHLYYLRPLILSSVFIQFTQNVQEMWQSEDDSVHKMSRSWANQRRLAVRFWSSQWLRQFVRV